MSTPTTPRVLVAGLGSIGRRHARLLSERDDVDDLFRRQLEHLLRSRQCGTPPLASGDDAVYALRLADAAIDSIETGQQVSLS